VFSVNVSNTSPSSKCVDIVLSILPVSSSFHLTILRIFDLSLRFLTSLLILSFNVVTILAIKRCKSLNTVTNIFIVCLAFADLLQSPTLLIYYFFKAIQTDAIFRFMMACVLSWQMISYDVSLHTHIAIAMDRYLAVIHPLSYKQIMTRFHAKCICFSLWCFALTIQAGVNFYYIYEKPIEDLRTKPLSTRLLLPPAANYILIDFNILASLLISILIYGRIFFSLIKRQNNKVANIITSQSYPNQDAKSGRRKNEDSSSAVQTRKITRMMVTSLCVLISCWTVSYVGIMAVSKSYQQGQLWAWLMFIFFLFILNSHSFLNPIIYAGQSSQFRNSFKALLKWKEVS
jgi:hypothetical protein